MDSFRVSKTLLARLKLGTAPRPKRSSGTKCKPSARLCDGLRWPIFCPCKPIAPSGARVSSPESANSNSRWPLPETPAIPTISPAWTDKWMPSRSVPKISSEAKRKLFTLSTALPGCAGEIERSGNVLPTISSLSDASLSWRGSQTPVTRPNRMTVHALHRVRISCNLWLM